MPKNKEQYDRFLFRNNASVAWQDKGARQWSNMF